MKRIKMIGTFFQDKKPLPFNLWFRLYLSGFCFSIFIATTKLIQLLVSSFRVLNLMFFVLLAKQVCPFSRVEQKTHNVNPTNLGRRADSIVIDKGQHLLMMTDGDTKLCPFGRARRSKVRKEFKVASQHLCSNQRISCWII